MDIKYNVTKFKENQKSEIKDHVSIEEPLEMNLRIKKNGSWQTENLSITMRTPGNDEDLIVGFLFNEKIIENIDQIVNLEKQGDKVGDYNIQNKIEATINDIKKGDLSKYSAIILPSQSGNGILHGHMPNTMPEEYTGGIGLSGTLALKKYVKNGGRIIALDASSDFVINQFGLPLRNAVSSVPSTSFFIPGSLVSLKVDDDPLTMGMQKNSVAYFVRSRAFSIVELRKTGEGGVEQRKQPPSQPVKVLARYAKENILLSGWAIGEKKYIGGKIAMASVSLGKGEVVLIGFRTQHRAQPRGTFKLLFNGLY